MIVLFLMVFNLMPTLKPTIDQDRPTGEDWNRHSLWIERYMSGDFTPILEYPPMFHFLMLPFYSALGYPNIKFMQPFFCILAFLSVILMNRKNLYSVLFTAIFLATSVSFNQFSGALLPETLDFIFIPIIYYLLDKKRYLESAIVLLITINMHIFGIFVWLIFLAYSLAMDRKFLRYLFVVGVLSLVISLPALYVGLVNIPQAVAWNEDTNTLGFTSFAENHYQYWITTWDKFFMYPIDHFLFYSGVFIWLLMPLIIYSMKKYPKYDRKQLFYTIWFFIVLPLVFYNIWRWWSFAVVPVALFCGSAIGNYLNANENAFLMTENA